MQRYRLRGARASLLASAAAVAVCARWGMADTNATWTASTGGSWAVPSSWSTTPVYPNNGNPTGINYQVEINKAISSAYTIKISNPSIQVDGVSIDNSKAILDVDGSASLTLSALNVNTGTFELTNGGILNAADAAGDVFTVGAAGTFDLFNGTINGGTVSLASGAIVNMSGGTISGSTLSTSGSSSINLTGGTFSGVTLNNTAFTGVLHTPLNIENGITGAGQTTTISSYNNLYPSATFDGPSQQISNLKLNTQGLVYVGGPASNGSATLTIGSDAAILANIMNGSLTIGSGAGVNAALINNGTMGTQNQLIIQTSSFTNNGTLQTSGTVGGRSIDIESSNWSNGAGGAISVNGGVGLTLAGNWSNAGSITAAGGAPVVLKGTVTTAGLGSMNFSSDVNVSMRGTLDNTNATFKAGNYGGNWSLLGGTILNGTIDTNSGHVSIGSGTLSGVTVSDGDLFLGGVNVSNGITTGSNALVLGAVNFVGPETIDSTMRSNSTSSAGTISAIGTVTFGPDANLTGFVTTSGDTLINNGTMSSTSNSAPLTIKNSSFTNNGLIQMSNGGNLNMSAAQWSNSSAGTIAGNHARILFGGAWSNSGTVSLTNSSYLTLSGTFSSAGVGNISASPDSPVVITGAMNNVGGTLTLNSTTGSWELEGGTITGGDINQTQGTHLALLGNGATLDNVRFSGADMTVGNSVTILHSLAVDDGNINLGNGTMYFASPTVQVDNVTFNGTSPELFLFPLVSGGPVNLILGQHTLLQGQFYVNSEGGPGTMITNNGTINASSSTVERIYPTIVNNGLLESTSNSQLNLLGGVTNTGTLALHGGGQFIAPNGLDVGDGTLTGSGIITGNVTMHSDPSHLSFNIGGTTKGTTYDSITVNGSIALAGDLDITFTNAFQNTITFNESFIVLTATSLSGSFLNVANGGRLNTDDGLGSFQVNYGSGNNEVVLSNFGAVVPEPASLSLLFGATMLLGARRRMKRFR